MKALGGFVLVGGVLLAAGVAWWLGVGPGDSNKATAQAVVQNACDRIERTESYDFTATITGAENGQAWSETLKVDGSISGNDYRVRFSAVSDGAWEEYKWIGGVGYYRSGANEEEWEIVDGTLHDITEAIAGVGDNPMCPDTEGVESLGTSEVGGASVEEFRGSSAAPIGSDGSTTDYQFWVDSNGQLVQHQRNDRIVIDGHVTTIDYQMRFSGVGEHNAISVPVVDGQ